MNVPSLPVRDITYIRSVIDKYNTARWKTARQSIQRNIKKSTHFYCWLAQKRQTVLSGYQPVCPLPETETVRNKIKKKGICIWSIHCVQTNKQTKKGKLCMLSFVSGFLDIHSFIHSSSTTGSGSGSGSSRTSDTRRERTLDRMPVRGHHQPLQAFWVNYVIRALLGSVL